VSPARRGRKARPRARGGTSAGVPKGVLAALRRARSVLVASHSPLDGDGLGAGLALQRALAARGRRCVVVTEDPPPSEYAFLPGHESVVVLGDGPVPPADLIVALDAGGADRLGRVFAERPRGARLANIDHHVSNSRYGDVNWIDEKAAAVGEQVYLLLSKGGYAIDPVAAQCLLVALVTDTGRFCYSSTTPRTLEIAAALVRLGAEPDQIQRELYASVPLAVLRLRARAADGIEMRATGRLALLTLPHGYGRDLGVGEEDVKDLIDVLVAIQGVVVAALFRGLEGGGSKVSLRSKDDRANVAALAARHGGGGHVRASGFTSALAPAAARERLLPELEALAVAGSG
jgi:phosphoesterase RecJ-like protein